MGNQHRHRTGLGLSEPTELSRERPLDSVLDGQGTGRRIEHQPDGLGPRAPQRLGPVRRRGRRSGVELRLRAGDLPPHRRLARRSRPRISRHRWARLRATRSITQSVGACHGGRCAFGRHSDVREPERRNDGVGRWSGTHRPAHPRRPARVGIPVLCLSPSRPAQPDRPHPDTRQSDHLRGKACQRRGGRPPRNHPSHRGQVRSGVVARRDQHPEGADALRHRRRRGAEAARNSCAATSSGRRSELPGPRRVRLYLGVPGGPTAPQRDVRGHHVLE